MEHGVGRLFTSSELPDWRNGSVRSAFAIGDGYVLTAWHCVRAHKDAPWWIRLQPSPNNDEPAEIPIKYENHSKSLDTALLVFDEERAGDEPRELRERLDAVTLPLGIEVRPHDDIRIIGFPELNSAEFATALTGKVRSHEFRYKQTLTITVQVDGFGTAFPEHPKGMSGGPLARGYPDDLERVVGIVSAFPKAHPHDRTALGGGLVVRRIRDLQETFPAIRMAVQRHAPPPPPPPEVEAELSPTIVAASRPDFEAAGVPLPARFTLAELSGIVAPQPQSRLADRLRALRSAVAAKPVLLDVGAPRLEIGRLQVIYRREVGSWPQHNSLDALLVEAADVRASGQGQQARLSPLAKFVVGTAAALSSPPLESPVLATWLTAIGHQIGDAQAHYLRRRTTPAWLVIDLGDEPAPGRSPWPDQIVWKLFERTDQLTKEVPVEPTENGLRKALRGVLDDVQQAWPLLVDIAMPYALLGKGIERWRVLEVDDELESLSENCRPRLRWSMRRPGTQLHSRCVDRTDRSSWDTLPEAIRDELLGDSDKLKKWLKTGTSQAWFVGGHTPTTGTDPLRVLLREGCGFLIWFPAGSDDDHRQRVTEAAAAIPADARRTEIPDELPDLDLDHHPAIIWDDPRGRDDFVLPPPTRTEHIQVAQQ